MSNPMIAKLEAEEAAIQHELNVLKGAIENAANVGSQRLAQMFISARDEIELELKAVQRKAQEAVASFKGKVNNAAPLNASLPPKAEAETLDEAEETINQNEAQEEANAGATGGEDATAKAPVKKGFFGR